MPHFIYQGGGQGYGGAERLSGPEIVDGSSHESIQKGRSLIVLGIDKASKANSAHYAAYNAATANKTLVVEVADALGPPCTHRGFKNKYGPNAKF